MLARMPTMGGSQLRLGLLSTTQVNPNAVINSYQLAMWRSCVSGVSSFPWWRLSLRMGMNCYRFMAGCSRVTSIHLSWKTFYAIVDFDLKWYRIPPKRLLFTDSFSLQLGLGWAGIKKVICVFFSGVIVTSPGCQTISIIWIKFGPARPCLKVPWLHVSSPRRTKCLQSFWVWRCVGTHRRAKPHWGWTNARMKMWKQRRNAYSKWIRENRSSIRQCCIHPFHPVSRAPKAQVMYVNGLRKVYGNFITGEVHWTSCIIQQCSTTWHLSFIII